MVIIVLLFKEGPYGLQAKTDATTSIRKNSQTSLQVAGCHSNLNQQAALFAYKIAAKGWEWSMTSCKLTIFGFFLWL